jgi:uncharacterized repeat protein (TIGR03803 family)
MARVPVSQWVCEIFLFCVVSAISARSQTFTVLADFNGDIGGNPMFVSLVQGQDGGFYGTTTHGDGDGSIIGITRSGILTALQGFNGTNGCCSLAGLILGTDGNFYGTSYGAGAHGYGTIFRISPVGTLTTLYDFCSKANCTDGASPEAALVQATDGNFYGTTVGGATQNVLMDAAPCFESPRAVLSQHSIHFVPRLTAPTACIPTRDWFRQPTGISME